MSPMPTLTVPQAFALAQHHHQAGRLGDAEALYRQILAAQPNHADVLHCLGVLAQQTGRLDLAVEWIGQSAMLNPANAAARVNLGEAFRAMGRPDEAIASFRRAIQLQPGLPEAHNNVGIALAGQGHFEEAMAAFYRALELRPDFAEPHSNLGNVLRERGRLDEAVAACRRAIQLKPDHAGAHNNLGQALAEQGKLEEVVAAYLRALQLRPDYPEAHYNLGIALAGQRQFDEATAAYRRALELRPDFAEAWNNLGNALTDQGLLDEALAAFRRGMEIKPANAWLHSNLIYTLHIHPNYDARMIAEELQRWNRQFAEPLRAAIQQHTHDRNPERRLRVGYVSPDFRFQAEVFFVLPLLEAHDHEQFEIHCYASVARPDVFTDRLRRSADVWHDVQGLSDEDLARQIRDDEIDILVDLTMHMARNRLLVFARRPAPVQVTWLAYPGSTGLETMDYRLTDHSMDPPGIETPYYSEESVRLPDSWCCYHPLTDGPTVNPLPAATAAAITFGCLNNFHKINAPTVALFAGVLRAVEGSRLILLAPEGNARQRVLDQFSEHGVQRNRIELVGKTSRPDYLGLYHDIDIGLDPLPYNGITTTCDALWMGVPVIGMAGKTAAGKAGLSLLSTVGLAELATHTPEQFVQTALQLATDRPALAKLREELRSRMESSPLMDAPRFARNVEAAYRGMWERWCAGKMSVRA